MAESCSRPQDIYIVIPAYEEGIVLRETVSELIPFGFTIIVVDDGSSSPASRLLSDLPLHCLRHAANLGQGAALETGMQFALRRGADIIVHFDADGQHSPALIQRLIAPIRSGQFDIAIGSRFLDPSDLCHVPRAKRILLRAGILISWMFSGLWLSDTHNGFRALSRTAAERIHFSENGFAHATEILTLIKRYKLRLTEIPATTRYTQHSMAKGQSFFNSFNIVFDLLLGKLVK